MIYYKDKMLQVDRIFVTKYLQLEFLNGGNDVLLWKINHAISAGNLNFQLLWYLWQGNFSRYFLYTLYVIKLISVFITCRLKSNLWHSNLLQGADEARRHAQFPRECPLRASTFNSRPTWIKSRSRSSRWWRRAYICCSSLGPTLFSLVGILPITSIKL